MKDQLAKDQFVAVFEAAGINATLRAQLHREFERQQPAARGKFLAGLGWPPAEIARIRQASQSKRPASRD